jgi:hypothetical protein
MLWYLYRKRFRSKIAWANRKEDDRVGAGPRYGTCWCEPWDGRGQTQYFDLYHPMAYPDTCRNSFTYTPVVSMWVVALHSLFLYSDPPLHCHPPSDWLRLFSNQPFSRINTPTFSTLFLFNNQPHALIIEIYSVIKFYMCWASSLPIIRSSLLYIRHWWVSCRFLMTVSKLSHDGY